MIKHLIGLVGTSCAGKSTLSNMTHGLILSKLHDEEGNKAISNWRLNEFGRLEIETDTYDPETQEFSPQFNELDVDNRSADFQMWARGAIWGWVKSFYLSYGLKKMCTGLLGLTYQQVYGDGKYTETQYNWGNIYRFLSKELQDKVDHKNFDKKLTSREVMEIVGTDILRTLDPDIYVKRLVEQLAKEETHIGLVTDIRRLNEAKILKENGCILVRLTRGNPPNISEVDINEIVADYTICNDTMTQEESCLEFQKILDELKVFDK